MARGCNQRGVAARSLATLPENPASEIGGGEIAPAPPDPILGIAEVLDADSGGTDLICQDGADRTEELLPCVVDGEKKAEDRRLDKAENEEYLPIDGLPAFKQATVELLLGAGSPALKEGRVATIQALSGTGSLRAAAAFLNRFCPGRVVYISDPTRGDHKAILSDAGVTWRTYRYFDSATEGIDLAGMIEDLKNAPEGSVVLLHGRAHAPIVINPKAAEWTKISDLCRERRLLPFFDIAYQGFGTGDLEENAFAPRLFVDEGHDVIVCQSFSKNLGLYAERIGALNVITSSRDAASRVLSQLKKVIRPMYSKPPDQEGNILGEAISSEDRYGELKDDMQTIASKIKGVRQELYDRLMRLAPDKDWSFVTRQIGMSPYTGMTPEQVANMIGKHGIDMTKDGRISLAALSSSKMEHLARAIVDSVRNF